MCFAKEAQEQLSVRQAEMPPTNLGAHTHFLSLLPSLIISCVIKARALELATNDLMVFEESLVG